MGGVRGHTKCRFPSGAFDMKEPLGLQFKMAEQCKRGNGEEVLGIMTESPRKESKDRE